MPKTNLQSFAKIDALPFSKGKTTSYSDPDAGVKGVVLSVSSGSKTWTHATRDGKKRIGSFPDIATIFQARDALDDQSKSVVQKSSASGSGVYTLMRRRSSVSRTTTTMFRKNRSDHAGRKRCEQGAGSRGSALFLSWQGSVVGSVG